jgi:hypothetical protein
MGPILHDHGRQPHRRVDRTARQAALICTWKPWQQATGPRSPEAMATMSRSAYKGGHSLMLPELSRMVNADVNAVRV